MIMHLRILTVMMILIYQNVLKRLCWRKMKRLGGKQSTNLFLKLKEGGILYHQLYQKEKIFMRK